MPGTWGTVAAIPLFYVLCRLPGLVYFPLLILLTYLSIICVDKALPSFAPEGKPEDPSSIVIDEVIGLLWCGGVIRYVGFWNPAEGFWTMVLLAFIFFRLFDVWKPWPIRQLERKYKGGKGVVIDDVMAGIIGGFVTILFCWVYPLAAYWVWVKTH